MLTKHTSKQASKENIRIGIRGLNPGERQGDKKNPQGKKERSQGSSCAQVYMHLVQSGVVSLKRQIFKGSNHIILFSEERLPG